MGTRLYVGNLPLTVTEGELGETFSRFGQVTQVDVIMERSTGRPRGFGFVEMEEASAAEAAIEALDGSDFGGRSLRVNRAQDRRESGGRGRG